VNCPTNETHEIVVVVVGKVLRHAPAGLMKSVVAHIPVRIPQLMLLEWTFETFENRRLLG